MIEIKETTKDDLKNIQKLWQDGEVMQFVGFPSGLKKTEEEMLKWLQWIISNKPLINHYSIYDDNNYCGETFYEIDKEHKSASLDIKLFKFARGKGIAYNALSYAIEEAFNNGAISVWVDPNPNNLKAIALYQKLGFKKENRPDYLKCDEEYSSYIFMKLTKK